jgi:hypothetical protein
MGILRHFLRDHRRLAALLLALALCMKALVPAGYMLGEQGKVLTVQICADAGGQLTKQIVIPLHNQSGESHSEHGKTDSVCPYSALTMASLSGADAPLLALALSFILALGFAAITPHLAQRIFHLRPPLRGPPALI